MMLNRIANAMFRFLTICILTFCRYETGLTVFYVPNTVGILSNGAIGGKNTGAGDVQDRHAVPALLVLICLSDERLGVPVAFKSASNMYSSAGQP